MTYKSGRTNKDADDLSGFAQSSPTDTLTSSELSNAPLHITEQALPSNLVCLQLDDTFCRQLIDQLEGSGSSANKRSRWQLSKFCLVNGDALYPLNYHITGNRLVPVIPRSLRKQVLEVFYDDPTVDILLSTRPVTESKARSFRRAFQPASLNKLRHALRVSFLNPQTRHLQ